MLRSTVGNATAQKPLETLLMNRWNLKYGESRKLVKEAREALGMDANEPWTPELEAKCCEMRGEAPPPKVDTEPVKAPEKPKVEASSSSPAPAPTPKPPAPEKKEPEEPEATPEEDPKPEEEKEAAPEEEKEVESPKAVPSDEKEDDKSDDDSEESG